VRYVRVTDDLWAQLESLFPQERPGDGTPSLHDFVSTTLVEVQRRFAEDWETLAPTIPGRTEYRTVWGSGPYVARFDVDGQLAPDGHIELTRISIEFRQPADEPEDSDDQQ
jgi:hypothetical protein